MAWISFVGSKRVPGVFSFAVDAVQAAIESGGIVEQIEYEEVCNCYWYRQRLFGPRAIRTAEFVRRGAWWRRLMIAIPSVMLGHERYRKWFVSV